MPDKDRIIEELLKSFDEYCNPKETRQWRDSETLSDSFIGDRTVCGINSLSLKERLIKEANLTLTSELSKEKKSLLGMQTTIAHNKNT